jgi:hypothetical protein
MRLTRECESDCHNEPAMTDANEPAMTDANEPAMTDANEPAITDTNESDGDPSSDDHRPRS